MKAGEILSVNRKAVFGLVFLLGGRCCCKGELAFGEATRLVMWENAQLTFLGGQQLKQVIFSEGCLSS